MPDSEGYVMVLQPEEPKISLSGIDHFARGAAEFESVEGVTLFPELRIVSTITREVEVEAETEAEGEDDPTGMLGIPESHTGGNGESRRENVVIGNRLSWSIQEEYLKVP